MYCSHWQSTAPRVLAGYAFDGKPYQISLSSDEPFGRGGSAMIHKGQLWWSTQQSPPLMVAVKMFHDHGAIPKEVREELLYRELRAARHVSMRHPSILMYLGTAYDGRHEAIVSLHMQNGNLLQYLKANPHSDKKKLILQVAEAVNYLHSVEHLVHGDLKCDNILVSDFGNALLADFGLSRLLELVQSVQATMTSIRQMHSVRFAAPELLVSDEDTRSSAEESCGSDKPPPKTYESDVYAFGMLVLEAFTEEPPWSGALKDIPRRVHEMAITDRVLKGSYPPQPTLPSGFVSISHAWWDICKRCWSHEPGHRPHMPSVLDALMHTSLEPYRQLNGHHDRVCSVAYLPSGRRAVSCSFDGTIRIWDTLTGRTVIDPLRGHNIDVRSVAVSPDGRQICSGGGHGTIRRWDAESGTPIGKPMTGHDDQVQCVAFSPDGTRIVSCSCDKTVRRWDATTGAALGGPLAGHTDWVLSVVFSPDGTCIASGSHDGTIRLWDGATGGGVGILRHPETEVNSVCFSPDRIHLVSGCTNGAVRIWNVPTRQLARDIMTHSVVVQSVAVSPSGRYIAAGSLDESIRIWDAQTGDPVGAPLNGHNDVISWVAFSPDGRSLLSGSDDRKARIWDLFE